MKPSYTQRTVLLASFLLATATLPLSADWVQVPLHDLYGGSALEVADGRLTIASANSASDPLTVNLVDWDSMKPEPLTVTHQHEDSSKSSRYPYYPLKSEDTYQWQTGSIIYKLVRWETREWNRWDPMPRLVGIGYAVYRGDVLIYSSSAPYYPAPHISIKRVGTDIYVSISQLYLFDDGKIKERINLIAYDGAITIIFNNRTYTNDDGQTWNYYETPLPANYISYAEGVFEYTAAPNDTNGLTTPVRARSTDQGKTWQSVGFTEAMPNYTMEAVWLPDSNTTELHVTVDVDGVETFSMPSLQVLDTAVFDGSFVVLAKPVTGSDAGKRSVWVYASEQSPLTTVSTTQEQMIDDGCWEVEFTDLPNVPFFKRVGHQNKSLFKLYAPTGRARNAIFGISDVSSYPWVVNADVRAHAYFKADGPTPAAFLWSPTEDWLYTAEGWYPFLWSFKHQNWIWIDAGETRTHWWFLYLGDGAWQRLTVE